MGALSKNQSLEFWEVSSNSEDVREEAALVNLLAPQGLGQVAEVFSFVRGKIPAYPAHRANTLWDWFEHDVLLTVEPLVAGQEKLEKNNNLVYRYRVNSREQILKILESDKSKEEIVDLLTALIEPRKDNHAYSPNKLDFGVAAKIDPGPLPENPVRYADRKAHPQYANLNAVEFLRKVWGPWLDSGAAFQDEVNRRDDKLIQAVRNYCAYLKLNPAEVLPPPKSARLDNEVSGSPTARKLVESRRAAARRYAAKHCQ
jgi:hypothetical protein